MSITFIFGEVNVFNGDEMTKEKMKNVIKSVIFYIYPKIFGKEPGPQAMNFIKNLSFIFVGLALSKFLSVFFQIYVGRTLGALEYGKFAIVNALSQFLYVPMLLGVSTALTRYLAEERSEGQKSTILSTGIVMIILSMTAFSIIFYFFSPQIASISSVSEKYVFAAIFLAFCYCIWITVQKILQGLDKMKKISLVNILWGACIVLAAVLLFPYIKNAQTPIIALCTGYIISSLLIIPEIRKYLKFKVDMVWVKKLLKYGIFIMLGTISVSITGNINILLLNMFLSVKEVGVYQAYHFSSLTIASFFVGTFAIVFFPEASRYENKRNLLGQINRLVRTAPVIYVMISVMCAILLFLYGKDYPITPPLILLFTLASVIAFIYLIYNWFAASIGTRGAKVNLNALIVISVLNVLTAYVLIPLIGVYGAVVSIIISYSAGLVLLYYMVKKLLSQV